MKKVSIIALAFSVFVISAFSALEDKLVTKDAHISFYSHTPVEDIVANNYKVVSTINTTSGDVVFSVPMQSFEFEKALMQKHYNSADFLDTKNFPKSKFTGKITNLTDVNFKKDGTYAVTIKGNLTIKEDTKPMTEKATITVTGNKVSLDSKMKVTLGDFGITFTKGKPSTNIAKDVEVTLKAVYQNNTSL
ncbi:YceI family protein [Arenibacter sp. GZD96]|uniref:YceI family protein n=1 Tax=Aurantibrevibacter litoralis TaxID=3106030 RepID=UPI002AFE4BD9|nr:YceI family protein [Arenibacter sp. GZD-96]MEA1786742.1 YceI family protein [Arenibacter sp. GZD-96]